MKLRLLLLLTLWCAVSLTRAQQVSLKTNLLYGATTTPNLGAEITLGKKTSIGLDYGLNPWTFGGDKMIRHWMVNPSFRYWFCQPFMGHFLEADGFGGQYRFGQIKLPFGVMPQLENRTRAGWYAGAGLSYGYALPLGRHWNLEGVIGVGYIYTHFKDYECGRCGAQIGERSRNYLGPTKLAFSLAYVF